MRGDEIFVIYLQTLMLKIEQQADLLAKRESLKKLSLFVLLFLVWRMSILYLYIEKERLSMKSVLIIG